MWTLKLKEHKNNERPSPTEKLSHISQNILKKFKSTHSLMEIILSIVTVHYYSNNTLLQFLYAR